MVRFVEGIGVVDARRLVGEGVVGASVGAGVAGGLLDKDIVGAGGLLGEDEVSVGGLVGAWVGDAVGASVGGMVGAWVSDRVGASCGVLAGAGGLVGEDEDIVRRVGCKSCWRRVSA